MTAPWEPEEVVAGLRNVGSPAEFFRATDARFGDQALADWGAYVRRTLAASMVAGGRFNAQCEFGAIYTATDAETAWAEVAARYAREGVPGLPASLCLLRIVVLAGRFVDLASKAGREPWGVGLETLVSDDEAGPDAAARLALAASVRVFADFLICPSARGAGANVPIFAGRDEGDLRMDLAGVERGTVPERFRQRARESW